MRLRRIFIAATLLSCGCFLERERQTQPTDPMRVEAKASLVQANVEACTRVYTEGQRILSKNPELPQRLIFRAAGRPEPEIFHQGSSAVVITQKLVEMCRTDGELAAVLSVELGRMIAEREALAPLEARQPLPHPPIEPVTFRGDGGVANPDTTRLRELTHYEQEQRRQVGQPHLPDPIELARKFLQRAGYPPELVERVKPQLRAAAGNSDLQQQLISAPRVTPFVPPGGP